MIEISVTEARLRDHLKALAIDIGERSVRVPENLRKTAKYIRDFYSGIGIEARLEPYDYHGTEVANVVAEVQPAPGPTRRILIGAHYDSVAGTVGADDNASAVAVQLETARQVTALKGNGTLDLAVVFVSFALEEPPAYGTRFMGSRVYAQQALNRGERIDGMICLEMVGYACREPGCQSYPFPLMFFGYPKAGDFIGIVGNFASRGLTRSIRDRFSQNRDLPVITLTVPLNGWIMPAVRLSDHASFWDSGFEAVMITDSAFFRNPHYHRPSDRPETLDYRFMAELVESLVMFLAKPAP
jgi:Zn-dependent M28 family amino/carboxypeptidase